MATFVGGLLECLNERTDAIHAWCVLPNHYHCLLSTADVFGLLSALGRLHGRTAHLWNGEENRRGRQVWCKGVERGMRSDRHHWATVNYIHHNPVRHGYATRWQDWPYSSAADYLATVGVGEARRIWTDYPVLDYGKGWDDPKM
jgi:putative transposase